MYTSAFLSRKGPESVGVRYLRRPLLPFSPVGAGPAEWVSRPNRGGVSSKGRACLEVSDKVLAVVGLMFRRRSAGLFGRRGSDFFSPRSLPGCPEVCRDVYVWLGVCGLVWTG